MQQIGHDTLFVAVMVVLYDVCFFGSWFLVVLGFCITVLRRDHAARAGGLSFLPICRMGTRLTLFRLLFLF